MKLSEKFTIFLGIALVGIFVTGLAWSISTGLAGFWKGLPVGVQLVSSLYDDERLFRNASLLTNKIKK